jgi:predicted amidohydrolase YtcJ
MTVLKKLFYGGRIYTMADRPAVCDAMIVDGDQISWVGSSSELSSVPSDSFELIDLDGQIILPGFIDSHTHLVFWALSRQQIDLDGATSYENALKIIRDFAGKQPKSDKSWLIGKGWKREQWRKIRWPHKSELDRTVPDRPVAIFSKDEHLLWVNSRALVIAGINKETPDPEGGEIGRDAAGETTGILRDKAIRLALRHVNPPSQWEAEKSLKPAFDEMYRQGCVGVTSFDNVNGFEVLQSLDVAGKLPVRVVYHFPHDRTTEDMVLRMKTGFGSEYLKIGGIKIFADGALGSQTALMLKPFVGSKDNVGIEATSPDELRHIVGKATKAGMACAIHAIGDRANRNVLDAFEGVGRHMSSRFRHRIEHCQIVHPQDIKRFAALKVVASMQPSHATADIDLMKRYLGKRQKDSYRFRTLAKLGLTMCFGSDAPIEPLNPLHGIYAAVTGKAIGGRICFNPRETITVAQAVKGFTIAGADAVGDSDRRGNLMAGKKADFIVLDRDIMRLDAEQITKTNVTATYINGELKYCADGFLG